MQKYSLLLILLLSASVYAKDRYYIYEMIIFENVSAHNFLVENWPQQTRSISSPDITIVNNKPSLFKETLSLDISIQKTMKEFVSIRKLLDSSSAYRILYQQSWLQKGVAKESTQPLIINVESIFSNDNKSERITLVEANEIQLKPELEGNVTIYLARYLHVLADLVFRKKTTLLTTDSSYKAGVEQEKVLEIPVIAHRKMRSEELHYIDHPLIGILIKAFPVKKDSALLLQAVQ